MASSFWLLKSEPDTHMLKGVDVSYPWSRLVAEKRGPFFGVRNYQARTILRDKVRLGDLAFFYHSSCKAPGIYGVARVCRPGYSDPDALDPASPFYDASHTQANPKWFRIDLEPSSILLPRPILLSELRACPALEGMVLLRQPRLSTQPVEPVHWDAILLLAQGPPAPAVASGGGAAPAPSAATAPVKKAGAKRAASAAPASGDEEDGGGEKKKASGGKRQSGKTRAS